MISLVENEADCHRITGRCIFWTGRLSSAYEEMQEYEILHDSLYSENVQEQIAELELRYKTQIEGSEIENLKIEREKAVKDMIRRTIGLTSIVTLTSDYYCSYSLLQPNTEKSE